jgi:hypothetical protein
VPQLASSRTKVDINDAQVYLKIDWVLPELGMAEDLQQKDFSLTCVYTDRTIRHIPFLQ